MWRFLVLAAASFIIVCSPKAAIAADQHVVETPDYTYNEILSCLRKKSAFHVAPEVSNKALEECDKSALGLTKEDFISFVDGLMSLTMIETDPPNVLKDLSNGVERELRPYFVANGPSLQMLSMNANDLATLHAGCLKISDKQEKNKTHCLDALVRLKYLLQNPLPEINRDENLTGEDYVWLIKISPEWVNSPNDLAFHPTCLWLMDPIGHVVYGKDGKPVTIWLDKGPHENACY
jgi:hypothetical protein